MLVDGDAAHRSESPELELPMLARVFGIVGAADTDRCASNWFLFLICKAFINLIFSGVTAGRSMTREDAGEGEGRLCCGRCTGAAGKVGDGNGGGRFDEGTNRAGTLRVDCRDPGLEDGTDERLETRTEVGRFATLRAGPSSTLLEVFGRPCASS